MDSLLRHDASVAPSSIAAPSRIFRPRTSTRDPPPSISRSSSPDPDLPIPMKRELHEQNRLPWNAAPAPHNSHKGDQAAFFREGGSTLFPEELELLGDLSGRTLVHLQCIAGQDTLSLARLGAGATGVDISDEAVSFAARLSAESGIAAGFERADVFDWLEAAGREGGRLGVALSVSGAPGTGVG